MSNNIKNTLLADLITQQTISLASENSRQNPASKKIKNCQQFYEIIHRIWKIYDFLYKKVNILKYIISVFISHFIYLSLIFYFILFYFICRWNYITCTFFWLIQFLYLTDITESIFIRKSMSQYQSYSQRTPQQSASQPQASQPRPQAPNVQITTNFTTGNAGSYQNQAIQEAVLQWSSIGDGRGDIVIHGQSDFALLKNLRNILLGLQTQFTEGGAKVIFTGDKKDDFNKRLILLQSEIEGLLKRKINYSVRDEIGGTRVMDYSGILNEKETQIVELEKKINNLEERLRRATARELELENHIASLYADLKRKQGIINAKNDVIMAEVATSNALREVVNRIRKNIETNRSRIGEAQRVILQGVNFPDVGNFEIKADALTKDGASSRSKSFQGQTQNQKSKTQLIQLFRQFERANNQDGISDADIERILEGFLVGFNGTKIKQSVDLAITRRKAEDDYNRLKQQFGVAVGIFQGFIERLRQQNPNFRYEIDPKVFDILKDHKIAIFKTGGDIVHLERFSERTVEVPVQDARTKHLIHLLAVQMKKFCGKYPKLLDEMDVRLTEFFQQQLIDVIQVDEVDRLVQIVKYVPQVVKVQNVYAYSSEKSRRIQFHLRVLVKALLEELEKLRRKTGAVLEIDQGVIGMINQQIMGVVDVDDILKVFRVVPKIVEVQKIVEKIVDRIVEVPQVIAVEKIVEKIIEVEKVRQVDRVVNVPLEVPTIVPNVVEKIVPIETVIEKIVNVPQIVERIVEVIREVPKVQIVQRVQERPVQVQRVVEVEKIINHIETKVEQVEVIVQKIVPTERIVEIIKQVPVIVEKIVEKTVQIPKIIEVQKLVEVVIPQKQVIVAQQINNHVEVRYQIVDRIIEKPIPIIQTVERIIEVPQIIEKIVQVERVVQEVKEVERIVQKIVIQDRIQEVIKQVRIPVEVIKEVPRQIERIVEVPVIHERIVTVQQFIEKPVVQRIENTIVKQVYLRDPIIVKEPKIIEVEKIVNNYIDVPKPIKYIEQKIVEVVKYVDRIKEVKVPVQKVIEKMVEVPKVVEVEKIVQKVVVVPRVVEKVVEVPQIVERVVPKIIIEEKIKQVQRIVQVPMIQDKVVEIEVPKNVYIEVEKIVQRIVDKLVQVPKYEEKVINNQVIVEKIIEVIKEVPRNIEVEKIVHLTIQSPQIIEVERQIIVPVEVPIPTEKIVEKIVPITEIIEKPVQVPQVVEKIVTVKQEVVHVNEVTRIEEKIVNNIQYKQIVKQVPYITQTIKQVEKVVEKIVPVQSVVQQIVTAQQIVEKVVERTTTVPKVYDVERLQEKIVQVPKIIEVERIIPQIINVNRYIQNIVEKIVEVPIIVQQIKEVVRQNEKIVEVRNEYETVKEVQSVIEKAVIVEKFKQVVRNINHIEKVLQIVDRFEQTPVEVLIQEEKLVEVPYILEKIVQKIVVMPQIVEVLKYVHEVTEKQQLGVAVGVDVATHEQRLKILTKDIKVNFDFLLAELRKLRTSNPNLKVQIEIIERFLAQLEQYILYPKIVQVPKEKIVQKIVEKDRVVTVPTDSERSVRMELTLSLLVQKLIVELKRLRKQNPNLNLSLQDDVKLIFFTELDQGSNLVSGDFNSKLKSFADSVYRKFESLGSWSIDHQMMLNSFLQERFLMANLVRNANLEIQKVKSISTKRDDSLKRLETEIGILEGFIGKIRSGLGQGAVSTEVQSVLGNIFRQFDVYITTRVIGQPVRMLDDLIVSDARTQSLLRQKDAEILRLRDRIFSIQKSKVSSSSSEAMNKINEVLRGENLKLKNALAQLESQRGNAELIIGLKSEIQDLQQRNLQLEQENSNLSTEILNMKRQYDVKLQIYGQNAKISHITSASKSPNLRSPVQDYTMRSPQYGQGLGDSQIKSSTTENQPSRFVADTSRSFGLSDSGVSGAVASRQTGGYDASRAGSISGSGINQSGLSTSGIRQGDVQSSTIQGGQPSVSRYQLGGQSNVSATGSGSISGSGAGLGLGNVSSSGLSASRTSGTGNTYQSGSGASYQSGTGATYQSGTGASYQAGQATGTGTGYPPSGSSYQYGTGFQSGSGATLTGASGTGSTLRSGATGFGITTQQAGQSGTSGLSGTSSGQSGTTQQGSSTRFGSNYPSYRGS